MQKNNITILGFLFVMLSVFSCKKDTDSYKRPYESGVYVDKESLESHKKLWEESGIKNYTYTYSYGLYMGKLPSHCYRNYLIDVDVRNDEVIQYVLKEYDGNTEENVTAETWTDYQKTISDYDFKSENDFLIENIYSRIENSINDSFEEYKKDSECYYNEIEFIFSEEKPFLLSFSSYNLIMQEDLNGNSGYVEIKIENFKEN